MTTATTIIHKKRSLLDIALDKKLRKNEMRILLLLLLQSPDRVTIKTKDVAETLDINVTTIYSTLKSLVNKGYIISEGRGEKEIQIIKHNMFSMKEVLSRAEARMISSHIRRKNNTLNMLRVILYVTATKDFPSLFVSTQWELAQFLKLPISSVSHTLNQLIKRDVVSLEKVRSIRIYTLKQVVYSPLYIKRRKKIVRKKREEQLSFL